MKVILTKDVEGTGKAGDLKEVKDGFARNALLPKGLAVEATKENIALLEKNKAALEHKKALEIEEAEKSAKRLRAKTFKIAAKAGEGGKLFGSVTAKDVASVLKREGFDLDKRKLDISEDIKTFGTYEVEAKFPHSVTAKFFINVSDN